MLGGESGGVVALVQGLLARVGEEVCYSSSIGDSLEESSLLELHDRLVEGLSGLEGGGGQVIARCAGVALSFSHDRPVSRAYLEVVECALDCRVDGVVSLLEEQA